jgi:Sulfatase-modifying factor enzyme 1
LKKFSIGREQIVIVLHLMNNWQMNMNLRRSIVALLLLCAVGMFALIAALANETASREPAAGKPGNVFRDCPDCPEMVVIPAGNFTMGSSAAEKSWAASQVGSAEGVADESPQHNVSLASFAMGKYDVTRAEYAAFVRETGHPNGDGCGSDGFEWKKLVDLSWHNPGYRQTDHDPVVCVSWQDAQAYIAWLNGKVLQNSSVAGDGLYCLANRSGSMPRVPGQARDSGGATMTTPSSDVHANDSQASASALIEDHRGCSLRGRCAPPLAKEIPPIIATRSWDSAWQERCREKPRC